MEKFRAGDCLKCLHDLALDCGLDTEYWHLHKSIIEHMIAQRVTAGNMNFSYGTVYLYGTPEPATRFAESNAYGSELITECLELYRQLKRTDCEKLYAIEREYPDLISLVNKKFQPILIVVNNILLNDVELEAGGSAEEILLLGDPFDLCVHSFRLKPRTVCKNFEISPIEVTE